MISDNELRELTERVGQWRGRQRPDAQRRPEFRTPSQLPVEQVYTPADTADGTYMESEGLPGEFPYLRGIHDWLPGALVDFPYVRRVRAAAGN